MKTTKTLAEQKTEPSMEEILASIRDIISGEDKRTSYEKDEEEVVRDQSSQDKDVLDLIHLLNEDGSVDVMSPFGSSSSSRESESHLYTMEEDTDLMDLGQDEEPLFGSQLPPSEERALAEITKDLREMEAGISPRHSADEDRLSATGALQDDLNHIREQVVSNLEDEDLLSEDALSEAAGALDALNDLADSVAYQASQEPVGGKTVESLMKELLRPMLKDWLDANLPSMVRTIVNEQVEKVIQQKVKGNTAGSRRKAA